MRATAEASAQQGIALQRTADDSPNRQAMLGNMLSDLNGFTSGPGATQEGQYQAFLNRYAPGMSRTFGMDPQRVASQESFAKLVKQIALAQTGALGAGTDEKLTTSLGANPNTDLSKLGNQQIIAMLQGNEDAIVAKNKAWQMYQQQQGPSSYGQFSTQFNQTFDPRVFQAMRMTPADRAQMAAAMPGNANDPSTDRGAFRQRFNAAVQSGMIPDPRKAAPGG